jgi:hypothetical protein
MAGFSSTIIIGGTDDEHSSRRGDDFVGDGGKVIDVHETPDLHEEPMYQTEIADGNSSSYAIA